MDSLFSIVISPGRMTRTRGGAVQVMVVCIKVCCPKRVTERQRINFGIKMFLVFGASPRKVIGSDQA